MSRTVYTIVDETTGETIAANTSLSALEDAGDALMEPFPADHSFIIEIHTLH